MKAIVTVIGKRPGGDHRRSVLLLAQHSINILDISQTILQDFTMVIDTAACTK